MNKEYFIEAILSKKYGPYFTKDDIYAVEKITKEPIIDKVIRDAFTTIKFENKLNKIANKYYSLTSEKQPTIEEVLNKEFGTEWTYYGDYFSTTLGLSNQYWNTKTIAIKKNITQKKKYASLKLWLWQNKINYQVIDEKVDLKEFAFFSILSSELNGEKHEQFLEILEKNGFTLESLLYSNIINSRKIILGNKIQNKWQKLIKIK